MSDLPKTLALTLLGVALICSATLRSILLPFALGLLLARWADVPVRRLSACLPRWLAAVLILSLAGLLVCDAALLLGVQLWRSLPRAAADFDTLDALFPALSGLAARLPGPLGTGAGWLVDQLRDQSGLLHTRLEAKAADLAARTAANLPGLLLRWGITLLSAFYACADWQRVRSLLDRLLPAAGHTLLRRLRSGALGWLRVQGRLFLLQFTLLWAGLALLGRENALFLALLAALTDALPLLGSGIVLLPWAAAMLVSGDWTAAGGLALLWAAAALCRSLMEPRLLGRQTGRSPLLSLLALYAGLRLAGVAGLILGPIALNALCFSPHQPDKPTQDAPPGS